MAVKKSFDMVSWTEWPDEEIKMRDEAAVSVMNASSRMMLISGSLYSSNSMSSGNPSVRM